MTKPLYAPKSKLLKGMTVYCNACGRNVFEVCKEKGKPEKLIKSCPNGDKHSWKMIVHVPRTRNERETRKLQSRNLDEATKEAIEFKQEVKSRGQKDIKQVVKVNTVDIKYENDPTLLVHVLSKYVGWLNNEDVPKYQIKERSKEHIKDVERSFKIFVQCLKQNGRDLNTFSVFDIDGDIIGKLCEYWLDDLKFGARNYNKHLSYLTSLLVWYDEEYTSIKNWFKKPKRMDVNTDPKGITEEDFHALQKIINPENGIQENEGAVKQKRYLFREWLADAFKLAMYTGRRREEVVNLNFKDVVENAEGIPEMIRVVDYKVTRSKHGQNSTKEKFIYVPVTKELLTILYDLGYDEFKNTDRYMLAPELKNKRSRTMSDAMSKGFSHYYKQINPEGGLTFKSMRKTYISKMSLFLGGSAKDVTGHSDDKVIQRHYVDKQIIARAAQNFDVFGIEDYRGNELENIRVNSKNKSKTKGVEK